MIPQKSGEVKKVCTSRVSNLGSFQDPISSSLEENPQNTPRCPENVKITDKHPAWIDIIDMYYAFYPLFKSFEYLSGGKKRPIGLNYPQKPLKRSWARYADGTEMSIKQRQTLSECETLIYIIYFGPSSSHQITSEGTKENSNFCHLQRLGVRNNKARKNVPFIHLFAH